MQSKQVPQLALMSNPKTDTSVKKVEWIEYRPIGQLVEQAPMDIIVQSSGNQYIDLKRSLLQVKGRIVKADGSAVGPDDHT